jgi:DNA-binding response OmpR family regulator
VALKTGVQDFLTKPFDPRDLVARIEQQLRWRTKPAVDANRAFTGERLGPYRPAETDVARRIDVTPVPSFFDRIWGKSPKPWALGRAA